MKLNQAEFTPTGAYCVLQNGPCKCPGDLQKPFRVLWVGFAKEIQTRLLGYWIGESEYQRARDFIPWCVLLDQLGAG